MCIHANFHTLATTLVSYAAAENRSIHYISNMNSYIYIIYYSHDKIYQPCSFFMIVIYIYIKFLLDNGHMH